ncbi:MAG: ATP-dependent Clp protease ATP-binding subunit ClpC [Flavobacteriaceae bacterium]|nr:ATP-dependent Clp protease ATP-binding subunit ClpC [Flavobacteriaceae bacterium]
MNNIANIFILFHFIIIIMYFGRLDSFSEEVVDVIVTAHHLAKKYGQSVVGSEFLLLVLVAHRSSVGSKALKKMEIRLRDVNNEINLTVPKGDKKYTEEDEIPFSDRFRAVAKLGLEQMDYLAHETFASDHLFLAMLLDGKGIGNFILRQLGADLYMLQREIFLFLDSEEGREQIASLSRGFLKMLGTDLTEKVSSGLIDPVIGRDQETLDTILVLCRRRKSNPCLVGEPGVGKTAVAEGLAQRIIASDVPKNLQECLVVSIDIGILVAGTRYRGMFETRLKGIINECKKLENIIILIDEIHTLIGTGAPEGAADAANLLKPALARGDFKCLGATTLAEYKKYIEKDAALERRFHPVVIPEPSIEETIEILWGLRKKYEHFHCVSITFVAMFSAANFGKQFIGDRFLPDKAIDLIDEAGSRYRIQQAGLSEPAKVFDRELTTVLQLKNRAIQNKNFEEAQEYKNKENDLRIRRHAQGVLQRTKENGKSFKLTKNILTETKIASVVSDWTGIPAQQVTENELERLKTMYKILRKNIVGQTPALRAVTRAIRRARAGLQDSERPIAALLFAGPTGTGKTELTKIVANQFFGGKDKLLRFDMSEYMEMYSISKLIGSPPGYLGYSDGGKLTDAVRRQPNSLVLFDELEKAHPKIYNLMLQIFDEGYITSAKGRSVSFKSAMIVVTSNAGAYAVGNFCSLNPPPPAKDKEFALKHYQTLQNIVKKELAKTFRPEFLNRLDEIIMFQSLQKATIMKIAKIMISDLERRMRTNVKLVFQSGFNMNLTTQGYDPAYGARPMRRAITRWVENPLSHFILAGMNTGYLVWDIGPDGQSVDVTPSYSEPEATYNPPPHDPREVYDGDYRNREFRFAKVDEIIIDEEETPEH